MKIFGSFAFATLVTSIILIVITAIGIALTYLYEFDVKTGTDTDWFLARLVIGLNLVGILFGIHCLITVFIEAVEFYMKDKKQELMDIDQG